MKLQNLGTVSVQQEIIDFLCINCKVYALQFMHKIVANFPKNSRICSLVLGVLQN